METHTRLTIEEREQIYLLINQGKSNREIAEALTRSHTTIARELARFRTRYEYSLILQPFSRHSEHNPSPILLRSL